MTEGSRKVLINLSSPGQVEGVDESRANARSLVRANHTRYLVLERVLVDDQGRKDGLLLRLTFSHPLALLLTPGVGENYRHCVRAGRCGNAVR